MKCVSYLLQINFVFPLFSVNGVQNGLQDESEVIYQRNRDSSPASQPDPKPAPQKPVGRGRGRGIVPGTGVGRGMGANFVAPPPGFGGLGRSSGWGTVGKYVYL